MCARTKRFVSFGLVLLPLTVGLAAAASSDIRLVDALAERDSAL